MELRRFHLLTRCKKHGLFFLLINHSVFNRLCFMEFILINFNMNTAEFVLKVINNHFVAFSSVVLVSFETIADNTFKYLPIQQQ